LPALVSPLPKYGSPSLEGFQRPYYRKNVHRDPKAFPPSRQLSVVSSPSQFPFSSRRSSWAKAESAHIRAAFASYSLSSMTPSDPAACHTGGSVTKRFSPTPISLCFPSFPVATDLESAWWVAFFTRRPCGLYCLALRNLLLFSMTCNDRQPSRAFPITLHFFLPSGALPDPPRGLVVLARVFLLYFEFEANS